MPHISVTIAGRAYRMACDEGQEEHLLGLGSLLDSKINELRHSFGEIGDMRLAVMAGITIADELAEARRTIAALKEQAEHLQHLRDRALVQEETTRQKATTAVNEAADRIEKLMVTLAGNGL